MKYLLIGMLATLFAAETEAATVANCIAFDAKGKCTKCQFRSVLVDGQCKKVNDQCKTWNSTGACVTCYEGWIFNKGDCVYPAPPAPKEVQYCVEYDVKGCTKCEFRAVLLSSSECKKSSDLCKTWDAVTANCTSCFDGYNLAAGQCKL